MLVTEASVITEFSVKTEDREFSAEGFWPKLLPKSTPEASAEVNFVLTLRAALCEKAPFRSGTVNGVHFSHLCFLLINFVHYYI